MSNPATPLVLVVEDDLLLRINAVEMIEDAGFDVLQAANADEAIETLQVRGTSASSLLTYKCPAPWTG